MTAPIVDYFYTYTKKRLKDWRCFTVKKKQPVKIALSPPWYTFANEVLNTVGKDPNVQVDSLRQVSSSKYSLMIRVKGLQRARALATIIRNTATFGNITVTVIVKTTSGTIAKPYPTSTLTALQIAQLYRIAFRTNILFSFVTIRAFVPGSARAVFPVFAKRVVQFYNDDLSDFYGNYNNVAAFSFRDVLKKSINNVTINFSTAKTN